MPKNKKFSKRDVDKYIRLLEKQIIHLFKNESGGHDIYHLKRVLGLALILQKKEGGDILVIAISAFLHDIHRIISNKNKKYCSPKESLSVIYKILKKVNFPNEIIPKVLHCIEYHEEYSFTKRGKTVSDIETLILQDADNLDAIGAMGIGRVFSYCGAHNIPMWDPHVPLKRDFKEHIHDAPALNHIYAKLLLLKDNMNTRTAKELAKDRHDYVDNFLKRFLKEWRGVL